MAAQRELKRKEAFLKSQEPFRTIAFLLIDKMLELIDPASGEAQRAAQRALVDEILHSIFFLGKIRKPSFSPESFLTEESDGSSVREEMLNELMEVFPRPFDLYSSQPPKRIPFSCVLDMIVLLGRQKKTDIKDEMDNLIKELIENLKDREDVKDVKKLIPDKLKHLVPTTICVSHRTDNKDQVKYYGVSMTATSPNPRKIMIAASCLGSWDSNVAGAVMSYFPEENKALKGKIDVHEYVSCEAFDLLNGEVKPPCKTCGDLFGLTTTETKGFDYGNCAENESLSNLFEKEDDVKKKARPTSHDSDEMRTTVESVRDYFKKELKSHKIEWRGDFYSPQ